MKPLEKAAYLKGLAEGIEIDAGTKEGRLTLAIIDALESFAKEIDGSQREIEALNDEVSFLSQRIKAMGDYIFDVDEDEDEDDELELNGDAVEYSTECPTCKTLIELDIDELEEGKIICPSCGEELEFELSCEDGCDCH